jgi:hypothetical protein
VQSYKPSRFVYLHADANAIGGRLQTPVEKFVPTVAPVSLPGVGGFTTARSEGFTFEEIVSCSAAYTRVESADHASDGSATILVTSVVENLNILEVFSAARIVSQLTIRVPGASGEIGVSTIGSAYEGVRVAGVACHLNLTKGLQRADRTPEGRSHSLTWSDVRQAGRTQAQALLSSFKGRNESDAYQWAERKYGWLTSEPNGSSSSMCSLVDGVETSASVRCHGHIIEIPHFGRITLGELVVGREHVQLVGVRADLGCAISGGITACCGGGTAGGDN